jgi:hypothetical protein
VDLIAIRGRNKWSRPPPCCYSFRSIVRIGALVPTPTINARTALVPVFFRPGRFEFASTTTGHALHASEPSSDRSYRPEADQQWSSAMEQMNRKAGTVKNVTSGLLPQEGSYAGVVQDLISWSGYPRVAAGFRYLYNISTTRCSA